MKSKNDMTRRSFLQAAGAAVPTLKLMLDGVPAQVPSPQEEANHIASGKFTPVDLTPHFTTSALDFGPRAQVSRLGQEFHDGLIRVLGGRQVLRGIPFHLGPSEVDKKSWVMLSTKPTGGAMSKHEIAIAKKASYVCLTQFCDWDPSEDPAHNEEDVTERVGQRLADVVFVYEDGSEHVCPIRRRFEVNALGSFTGHMSFLARPHRPNVPSKFNDPLEHGNLWGNLQEGVWDGNYAREWIKGIDRATLWICALENPKPDLAIKTLRFQAVDADPLLVCGVTLYHGREYPLRLERLTLYRLTLPEVTTASELAAERWKVEVDLGTIARTFLLHEFELDKWLASPMRLDSTPLDGRHLYIDMAASRDATLTLQDTKTNRTYSFELVDAASGQEVDGTPVGARLQVLYQEKTWLHCRVVDGATKKPTPVRLAFRSKEGRYLPPYGHRTDINTGWFQDYGADIVEHGNSYAYVDGEFQVELPVGEVYLDMSKGFEYEAVRGHLHIKPGQRELTIEMPRLVDLRARGWVTADTHVHFLPPTTAVLQGQAEGVNMVNLLAAQWSELFTNVGDLWVKSLASRDGETVVRMGTENRQHLLGHLGLLGAPVSPMSAAGGMESYIGDPLWRSMSEWADECHQRDGLVVGVHFPFPTGEMAAEVALNKLDAVELKPSESSSLVFQDWYRYLNCGYRLAAVGGTDKMDATVPLGALRTYAHLGQEEFSFANWAAAVKKGNTFSTIGPLILFEADGHVPGSDIVLRTGGGTIEVKAEVMGREPVGKVEVIWNGHVVASHDAGPNSGKVVLQDKVRVDGPGWLAARCVSSGEATAYNFPGQKFVQAHSSPVYVTVPGRDLFSAPAASYMLTLIDGAESWAKQLATRPDAERFASLLKTFTNAREHLHRRLHEHGIAH